VEDHVRPGLTSWSRTSVLAVYTSKISPGLGVGVIRPGVGVMKDYNLTLRNLRGSHTSYWFIMNQ
jgi:hypothetical protein